MMTATEVRKRLAMSLEEFSGALGRSPLIVKKYGLQRQWPAGIVVQMLQRWPDRLAGWELRPDLYPRPVNPPPEAAKRLEGIT